MTIETMESYIGTDAPPGMFTRALRLASENRPAKLRIQAFPGADADARTYLVYDEASRIGVVIDPAIGDAGSAPLPDLVDAIERLSIDLHFSLETCAAGQRATSSPWLARRFGPLVVTSRGCRPGAASDEASGDVVTEPGDQLRAGPLRIEVVPPAPGTSGVRYRIGDAVFPPASASPRLATRRPGQARLLDPDPAAAA